MTYVRWVGQREIHIQSHEIRRGDGRLVVTFCGWNDHSGTLEMEQHEFPENAAINICSRCAAWAPAGPHTPEHLREKRPGAIDPLPVYMTPSQLAELMANYD